MDALRNGRSYTYNDYASWPEEVRYELIDGEAYRLVSGESPTHQGISGTLSVRFLNFLRPEKPYEVIYAPFDVCLNGAGDDDDTVVQPDIVICTRDKFSDGLRCNGAPDMVVEILSPSTGCRDTMVKLSKYMQTGVREYWILDPNAKLAFVYTLNAGRYSVESYTENDTVPSAVLNGCEINLKEVFDQ